MTAPLKYTKSIERHFSPYFVFGEHPDGKVDVADSNHDTLVGHVTVEDAQRLVKERQKAIDAIIRLANGESLDSLLYGIAMLPPLPGERKYSAERALLKKFVEWGEDAFNGNSHLNSLETLVEKAKKAIQ
jgi:hypothetical protein